VDRQGRGVIARSVDGGRNWVVTAMPDHPAGGGGSPVPVTDCSAVRFFDNVRGVALCTACSGGCDQDAPSLLTVLVWSSDGGQNWTMDPDYEPLMSAGPFGALAKFSGMVSLAFPDPNSGFITGQNNLVLRYTAAQPEPAQWGPASCDPSAGGSGSGGSGASAHGTGAAAAGDSASDGEAESGCGCALPGTARELTGWVALAAIAALGATRRRRRR
jgi:MYXO-CTERM domain-containing protein